MKVACQKHDFQNGICATCGEKEAKESLEAMEREISQPKKPKLSGNLPGLPEESPKKKAKKITATSPEESAMRVAVARANARTIVEGIEGAKKIAVEQFLGMDFSAAKITPDEEAELVGILTRFLDSVGWDLSNPKATLAMLLLAEARITLRQYQQLQKTSAKEKNAVPEQK